MNEAQILDKVYQLEAHTLAVQRIATELKQSLVKPVTKKRLSGLTEEKKARLEAGRMKTILKNANQ